MATIATVLQMTTAVVAIRLRSCSRFFSSSFRRCWALRMASFSLPAVFMGVTPVIWRLGGVIPVC